MADVHSKELRSFNMSRIGSKNTGPELLVRKHLFKAGFRYRIHASNLPGTPDVILPRYKTVIFIHGCFWHSHPGCRYAVYPKSNTEYWRNKLTKNADRDGRNAEILRELGWNVIIIWECDLKKQKFQNTMDTVIEFLKNTLS